MALSVAVADIYIGHASSVVGAALAISAARESPTHYLNLDRHSPCMEVRHPVVLPIVDCDMIDGYIDERSAERKSSTIFSVSFDAQWRAIVRRCAVLVPITISTPLARVLSLNKWLRGKGALKVVFLFFSGISEQEIARDVFVDIQRELRRNGIWIFPRVIESKVTSLFSSTEASWERLNCQGMDRLYHDLTHGCSPSSSMRRSQLNVRVTKEVSDFVGKMARDLNETPKIILLRGLKLAADQYAHEMGSRLVRNL